ncbi:MAG: 3-dehydro-scyllo-inosose hydrolase [Bacillota bacterium]
MGRWKIPPEGGHMDRATGVYFQNMTGRQVADRLRKNDLIIVPIGSTENHGAGGPYGEDTFLVTRMAEAVALETGCTVAQPIWYGSHPAQHLGMPGTVVIPEDVFCAYLRAVAAGLWNAGFRKQIWINGHGQEYVIPVAIHQFAKKYQVPGIIVLLNWPTAIVPHLKDRAHGGPFETPFRHADEAETSLSVALFPEMVRVEDAVDTQPRGFVSEGHVDKGGDIYQYPIPGHCQVGLSGLEVLVYPEGVIGRPTLADGEKARPGLEALFDYMVKLIGEIMERFPPGQLPPIELVTQRPREEVEAVLKGPLAPGGRHLYTLGYPP